MADDASMTTAPIITGIKCTAGGKFPTFQISWAAQKSAEGVLSVLVTNSKGNEIKGDINKIGVNGCTWTAKEEMSAASNNYYIQSTLPQVKGAVSDAELLAFAPATKIFTNYDGKVVTVTWNAPDGPTPPDKTSVRLKTGSGTQTVTTASGVAVLTPESDITAGDGGWTVTLTPYYGVAQGPDSDPAPVCSVAPPVTALTVHNVTSDKVKLSVFTPTDAVAPGSTPSFVVQVLSGTTVLWTSDILTDGAPKDGQYVLAGLNVPLALDGARLYALALAQAVTTDSGSSIGPLGLPMDLLLMPPEDVRVAVAASGNDRIVTVTVVPPPGPWMPTGARIALYDADGTKIDGSVIKGAGFAQTATLSAPVIGAAYTAAGAIIRGSDAGPHGSLRRPLITSIPAFTAITVDQGTVSLAWLTVADTGVSACDVTLAATGAPCARGIFTGTGATMALPVGAVTATIAAVGPGSVGPAATPVALITAAPTGLGAACTSAGTDCTLSWTAPAGSGATPDGYAIRILSGDRLVHQDTATGTSFAIPAGVLTTGGDFRFGVRATTAGANGRPALAGPWSLPAPILTAAPGGLTAGYDGATLVASWRAVPGATGYRVALLTGTAESGEPWYTTNPATRMALAFDAGMPGSLAVQAMGPGTIGPAASTTVFGAGFYPSLAPGRAAALIPATAPAMAPYELVIGLPQIFVSAPAAASLPAIAPFTLTEAAAPYAYCLTIADDTPWTFDAESIRAGLSTACGAFLDALETLGATAFGLQTVQAAIARAMPQTFAETLYYTYGFDSASGVIDLRPGMVLRVEYESYQTLGNAVPDQAYLNGFVTSAVAHYPIARTAGSDSGFTTLDAFVGWLVAQGGTTVSTPAATDRKQGGGGGLIDSGYAQLRQPFLRLVYPSAFPGADQTGTAYPEFNALLIAAPTLAALNTATDNMRAGNSVGSGVGTLYFRGRATLVPQIRIWIEGAPRLVSVGTTIGAVLAERAMEPAATPLPLLGVTMRRGIGPAPAGAPAVYDAAAATPVRLDWVPAANPAILALPVLGGDRIDFVAVGTGA